MKTIGLIVAMLFSVTSWGATPAKIPATEVGGRTIIHDSNYKVLFCPASATLGYNSCRLADASAGYNINTGTGFRVMGFSCVTNANVGVRLMYGNSDQGLNNGSPPTSVVYYGTGSTAQSIFNTPSAAGSTTQVAMNWLVPQSTTRMIHVYATGANVFCHIYGKDE